MKTFLLSLFLFSLNVAAQDLSPLSVSATSIQGFNISGTTPTNGQCLKYNSGTSQWEPGTCGGGGGTVTSVAMTVPAFLSVSGSPITTSGTLAVSLSGTALPILNGGTGATSANSAFNNLAPSQTSNSGKFLTTDGTNTSWATVSGGGSPGGADTNVQFNDSGAFGGNANFVFDKTNFRVGIGPGATTPSSGLDVRFTSAQPGSGELGHFDTTVGDGYLTVQAHSTQSYFGVDDAGGNHVFFGTSTNVPLKLRTNGSARVTVDGNGLAGFGTETPDQRVTVNGNIKMSANGNALIGRNNDDTQDVPLIKAENASNRALTIGSSTTVGFFLDIDGNFVDLFTNNSAGTFELDATRMEMYSEGAGTGATISLSDGAADKNVEIKAQDSAMAADWTLTLPPNDGTAGQFLQTDGNGVTVWASGGGGGGTPGGADTNVQFNDGGSFGGDANFYWDKTSKLLTVVNAGVGSGTVFRWQSPDDTTPVDIVFADQTTSRNIHMGIANASGDSVFGTGASGANAMYIGTPTNTPADIDFFTTNVKRVSIPAGGGLTLISGNLTIPVSSGVAYATSGGVITTDNSNFFWDDTSGEKRLGLGTNTPAFPLDIKPVVDTPGLRMQGSGPGYGALFQLDADLNSSGGHNWHFAATGGSNGVTGGGAFAIIDKGTGGSPTDLYRLVVTAVGHILFGSSPPSVGSCGTSPSVAGNDTAGRITVGTGGVATSCTLTFESAFGTKPACVVADEDTSLLLTGKASTTDLVITAATPFTAGDEIVYHCFEYLP